jgi:glutathione S-transferase
VSVNFAGSIDLAHWPSLTAYVQRLLDRPTVARAVAEERVLYGRELARHAKAG